MKGFDLEPDSTDSSDTSFAGFQTRRENHLRSRAPRDANESIIGHLLRS